MNTLKDYVDWKLTHADKIAEVEGYPLIMENCKRHNPLKDLKVYGNCFQDGTPTPENPIEVQSVGDLVTDESDINYGKYKIAVVQRGKNLFNIETLKPPIISTTYAQWLDDHSGVTMSSKYENGNSLGYLKNLCPDLKVGDKFVFDFETNAVRNGNPVRIFYLVGASLEMYKGTQYTCTQAMLDSQLYAYSGQTEYPYIKNIQFEIGDTVTNYESYKEPIITNIFLDEPLRKLGDYTDYIDFKAGKVVRIIKEFAMAAIKSMGLYAYTNFGCTNTYRCVLSDMKNLTSLEASTYTFPIYSNMFPNGGYAAMQTKTSIGYSEAKYLYFNFEDENNNYGITDVDSCRAWLVQNNPIIYYPMDTPTEEPIYCELPKLDAKTTIIEVDTSLTPSNAYGKYIKG